MIKAYLQIALCVKNENAAAGTGVLRQIQRVVFKDCRGRKIKRTFGVR